MAELSAEQEELRRSIQKSAIIWALVIGGIAGAVAYWLLGSQGQTVRTVAALVVGGGAGFLMFRQVFGSKAKEAKCEKCGAAFSTTRTNKQETLVSSEEKETRERQDDGATKFSRWTEEKFDVVETYECSSCGYISTRQSQITRRKDEESVIEQPHGKVAQVSTKSSSSRPSSGKAVPGKSAPIENTREKSSRTRAAKPLAARSKSNDPARPQRKQKGPGGSKSRP